MLELSQALLSRSVIPREKHEKILKGLMKIVCIGTVGDVVSLAAQENRAIVALGIEALIADRANNKPGLQALLNVSGITDSLTAQDVGFKLAPRINAAGRMADPALVERLLFSVHRDLAQDLAKELDTLNTRRKEIQQEMVDSIAEMVPEPVPNFIVITGTKEDGFHKGVSGIVAARLRDQFHRPVAVASGNGKHLTGSIRSIGEVHAVEALDQCADLLTKYGGHPVAAGFSLKQENLAEFEQRLNDYVTATTDPEHLVPVRLCQVKCTLDELNFQSVQAFMRMEPFGKDNYKPLVWLSDVQLRRVETMGKENDHVRCLVGDMKAIWWRAAEHVPMLKSGPVDLLVEPGFNRFNGRTTVQLTIVDVLLSKG